MEVNRQIEQIRANELDEIKRTLFRIEIAATVIMVLVLCFVIHTW